MSGNSSTLFNILLLFFFFFLSSSFMILGCHAFYLQLLANPLSAVSLFVECDFCSFVFLFVFALFMVNIWLGNLAFVRSRVILLLWLC